MILCYAMLRYLLCVPYVCVVLTCWGWARFCAEFQEETYYIRLLLLARTRHVVAGFVLQDMETSAAEGLIVGPAWPKKLNQTSLSQALKRLASARFSHLG